MRPVSVSPALILSLAGCALSAIPVASSGQSAQSPVLSGGIGAGLHHGEFGGAVSNGVAVSLLTWLRVAPIAAIRGDLSYAFNLNEPSVCVTSNPCPLGAPSQVPALGIGAMVGNLATNTTRPYLAAGGELLFNSLAPELDAGPVTVPKLGVGVLTGQSLFIEVTARWRNDWHGWRLRHWLVLAGWYH